LSECRTKVINLLNIEEEDLEKASEKNGSLREFGNFLLGRTNDWELVPNGEKERGRKTELKLLTHSGIRDILRREWNGSKNSKTLEASQSEKMGAKLGGLTSAKGNPGS